MRIIYKNANAGGKVRWLRGEGVGVRGATKCNLNTISERNKKLSIMKIAATVVVSRMQ